MQAGSLSEAVPNYWPDRVGSIASGLCAVHCALCGLLPLAFTSLGLGVLLGHGAEWVFSITAIALGLIAMIWGWLQHRSTGVAVIFAIGILGLLGSRWLEMSGEHDEHHHAGHHEQTEHSETRAQRHHRAHAGMEDSSHLVGTFVGVGAGILLLLGHIESAGVVVVENSAVNRTMVKPKLRSFKFHLLIVKSDS